MAAERFGNLGLLYRDVRLAGSGVAYWLALQCETQPELRMQLALGAVARFYLFSNRLKGEELATGEEVARFISDIGKGFRLDYRSIAANQLLLGMAAAEARDPEGMNNAFNSVVGALQNFQAPCPDWIGACLELQAELNRSHGDYDMATKLVTEAGSYRKLANRLSGKDDGGGKEG